MFGKAEKETRRNTWAMFVGVREDCCGMERGETEEGDVRLRKAPVFTAHGWRLRCLFYPFGTRAFFRLWQLE